MNQQDKEKALEAAVELMNKYVFMKIDLDAQCAELTQEILDTDFYSERGQTLKKKIEENYSKRLEQFAMAYKYDNYLEDKMGLHEADRGTCFQHRCWKDECLHRHDNLF